MPPAGTKVAVAMSGGVDSTAAAMILLEAGCDVTGITFFHRGGTEADRRDAAAVTSRIGIPHLIVDFGDRFHDWVIRDFREQYLNGRTPNPCVRCNRTIKFGALLDRAVEEGCSHFATGHYVRLLNRGNGPRFHRGSDHSKDQSYMLWAVRPSVLSRLVFPVGGISKDEARALAARGDRSTVDRPESQDVCFLDRGELSSFLGSGREGAIIDREGKRIGTHKGAARYTIGQRRGLGVSAGEPLYVTGVDVVRNIVRLGVEADLLSSGAVLTGENLFVPEGDLTAGNVEVKIRYRHAPTPAVVERGEDGALRVLFVNPQRAVTPGQSAVFYRGEELIGGAIIDNALPAAVSP